MITGALIALAVFTATGAIAFPYAFAPRHVQKYTFADGFDAPFTLDVDEIASTPIDLGAPQDLIVDMPEVTERRDDGSDPETTTPARRFFFARWFARRAPAQIDLIANPIVDETPKPDELEEPLKPAAAHDAPVVLEAEPAVEYPERIQSTPAPAASVDTPAPDEAPSHASPAALVDEEAQPDRIGLLARLFTRRARTRTTAPTAEAAAEPPLRAGIDRPLGFTLDLSAPLETASPIAETPIAVAESPIVAAAAPTAPVASAQTAASSEAAAPEEISSDSLLAKHLARTRQRNRQTVDDVAQRFQNEEQRRTETTYTWAQDAIQAPAPVPIDLGTRLRLVRMYGTMHSDSSRAMLERAVAEDVPEVAEAARTLLEAHG